MPQKRAFLRFGQLAQLVRALLSHGRGHRFESSIAHLLKPLLESDLALPTAREMLASELMIAAVEKQCSSPLAEVGSMRHFAIGRRLIRTTRRSETAS